MPVCQVWAVPVCVAVLRLGADYLMRCNLNPKDASNPVFVAQLGDPNRYVTASDPGYYPAADGKVWTSVAQDPALTGDLARPAWVMTRENPGADLLSGVAAALSAASLVLAAEDAAWAGLALTHARYLYAFGTSQSLSPKSACASMPCTTEIVVQEQVTAVPLVSDYDGTPRCYWADWNAKTCRVAYTSAECDELRQTLSDVFTNKQGCCEVFVLAGTWSKFYTGAQGICALPEDQTTCYVPDRIQRTCYEQTVNLETGVGCSGVGIEVFPTTLGCCTYLNSLGVVSTSSAYGQGLCARVGVDLQFTKCYVPSVVNATCMELSGAACAQFGAETSFDQPIGCCNRLITMLSVVNTGPQPINATGVCTSGRFLVNRGPSSPPPPPSRPPPKQSPPPNSPPVLLTPDSATPTSLSPPAPAGGPGDYTNVPLGSSVPTSSVGNTAATSSTPARLRRSLQESGAGAPSLWSRLTSSVTESLSNLVTPGAARRSLLQTASPAPAASSAAMTQTQLQTLSLAALLASLINAPSSGSSTGGISDSLSSLIGGTSHATTSNATQWPLPQATDALKYDPCAEGTCRVMTVNHTMTVPFFNSTSVLDDMAWGAVWLHRATGEAQYLGQAELFMKRHKQEEMVAGSLQFTRQYYVPDWNNVAWATEVLLANATSSMVYHERLRSLLSTWTYADSLPTAPTQPSQIKARTNPLFNLQNFTDAATNSSYAIVPDCRPTALYESAWNTLPARRQPVGLALAVRPVPHAVHTPPDCLLVWTQPAQCSHSSLPGHGLLQASLDLCGYPTALLGTGTGRPYAGHWSWGEFVCCGQWQQPTHHCATPRLFLLSRVSPCAPQCHAAELSLPSILTVGAMRPVLATGYYPNTPNPQLQLIHGALVAGPGLHDDYTSSRANNQTQVSAVNNAAFTGLLAALTDTGTTLRTCEGLHGVWQRYVTGENNI
ncbi:uncharacterized protein HaLaN_19098 [Haematococcus lacustris]|uniref:cellulase n=1 Tax=Haematococcus lacustris TaxID=44745 RepID=A0A699ZSK8_HAELA|nr:uncharacterized protein HaLaN_19098 [Haematococcus lacustris]